MFTIIYSVSNNGLEVEKKFEIPIDYLSKGDSLIPVYPTVSNKKSQVFNQEYIDRAFSNISAHEEDKYKFKILKGIFEVYVMEENLARYISSSNTFENSFSVKVYEPIVSNINGGLGVFGGYKKLTLPVDIFDGYIHSFGYRTK